MEIQIDHGGDTTSEARWCTMVRCSEGHTVVDCPATTTPSPAHSRWSSRPQFLSE